MGYLPNASDVTNVHGSSLESKHLDSTVTSYNFTTENLHHATSIKSSFRHINEVRYGNYIVLHTNLWRGYKGNYIDTCTSDQI